MCALTCIFPSCRCSAGPLSEHSVQALVSSDLIDFLSCGCLTGPAPARNITRPGPLGGTIEFNIASYLIVASAGTTLSVSHGWYDSDYCWWPEFDVVYGTPLHAAVRTSPHAWTRNYTRATVHIDVSSGRNGQVYLL